MPVRLIANEEALPGYRLIERLGRGGFGEVWKCEAPGGLLKAIKFVFGDLDDQDDENTRAAEQEKKALERVKGIRHPYILSLERYDVVEGQLIIVMELADRNLWDRFRECRNLGLTGLPRDELLKYMEEIAEALDLMNNHYNIQHLDIKPQNLFLVFNHVKVADFGLAKMFEGVRGTITGGVTPVYAAPETFEGYVSRYTDQYSLAIVFQELLTGTRPFNGANTKQLLMQHLNGEPDLEPLTPADRAVIGRALAKKPDARWPSCTDLVKALKQPAAAFVPARSAPVSTPAPRSNPQQTPMPGDESSRMHTKAVVVGSVDATGAALTMLRPVTAPRPAAPGAAGPTPHNGLPGLVTPRLVTPQGAAGGLAPAGATLRQPVAPLTAPIGKLGLAPPEIQGHGVLMPVYAVAVGRVGLYALQKLRAAVREKFGSVAAAGHVRWLYLDTDPAAPAAAAAGPDPMPEAEVFVARLQRPQHYQNRDGLPPVEAWLPPGALYKLPKNPGPANGVRAFGRLALFDNVRAVLARVRADIEAGFLKDDALTRAAAISGLGVRSNRGRILVFAGLGGGTGGGMALDLAFLLKNEFRQIGYAKPKCHAFFLIPPADPRAARSAALGNTYAALAELSHFHRGRARYQCRFETAAPAVTDADGPFARVSLFQLPTRPDDVKTAALAGLAARHAYLDLFTPVGRVLDEGRAEADLVAPGPTVSAPAQFRLTWPRRELVAAGTERLVQKLIQRWTGKDTAHLKEPVHQWLDVEWAKRKLDLDDIVDRLNGAVRETLREDPDRVFDAFVDPLRSLSGGAGSQNAEAAASVLDQLLAVVGKPDLEHDTPGSLHPVLMERQRELLKESDRHMAHLAVSLIEQTQYRVPGAEEALAQLDERLKRVMDGLEGVRHALAREVRDTYARLFALIGGLAQGARRAAVTGELIDHLRTYPRKRLKLLVLDATLSLYRMLQGTVPEYLREVNNCRVRLSEIAASLGAVTAAAATPVGPGRMILPHGVSGLAGAADQFLAALPPQDLIAFDQAVQKDVLAKFHGVVNVCTKGDEHTADFQAMLLAHASAFLDARLEQTDPAEAFLRYRGVDAFEMRKMLGQAFDAAAPDLTSLGGKQPLEMAVFACPFGPAGEALRAAATAAAPGVPLTPAVWADDIAFVREYPALPLAALPQTGPVAREAYDALAAGGDHPPHTRGDVAWADPASH